MFTVGQMVYHKTRGHSGKVVDCEGDTVYFVQANGVEVDKETWSQLKAIAERYQISIER